MDSIYFFFLLIVNIHFRDFSQVIVFVKLLETQQVKERSEMSMKGSEAHKNHIPTLYSCS